MDASCPRLPAPPDGVASREDLLAQGWVRRFVADPLRVKEALELYPRMGFEVRTEPVTPADVGPECASCPTASCPLYQVVYTRRRR